MTELKEEEDGKEMEPLEPLEVQVSQDLPPILQSQSIKKERKGSQYKGIFLAICAGLLSSIASLLVKRLKGYHVFSINLFRFTGVFLCAVPVVLKAIYDKNKKASKDEAEDEPSSGSKSLFDPIWPPTDKKRIKMLAVLFGRGFVGFSGVSLFVLSVQYLPLGDATVISSCSTVFVAVAAHLCLKEKCSVVTIFNAVLTAIGVAIISKPPILTGAGFDKDNLIGTGVAVARLALVSPVSVAIVFIRYLRPLNSSLVVGVQGFIQLLLNVGGGAILGVLTLPHTPIDWGLLVPLGFLSCGSQILIAESLKCEQAGPFIIANSSSETVFAFILQFVFLGVVPTLYSIIGGIIVTCAVCLTLWRKWLLGLPDNHSARKRYSFLLK